MHNEKPINKLLIIISFIVLAFLSGLSLTMESHDYSNQSVLMLTVYFVLSGPFLTIWFKALWNEIIPRISSWRKITFIEALGLLTLFFFVFN